MLQQLTYKKKNLVLLGGAVLFALVIYFSAINKTIDLYSQCDQLEEQLLLAENASGQLAQLQNELQEIESIFSDGEEANNNYQQLLMETVSNYCFKNKVVLREFPTPTVLNEQDFSVETNMVVVAGNFTDLLKLAYLLEQKNKTGKIASLQFQTKRDYKTKQIALTANIYLQNVKKVMN